MIYAAGVERRSEIELLIDAPDAFSALGNEWES